MTDVATRVESTGFYAGQNRLVALTVKVVVVSLVLWASLAPDAGAILMEIQAATISYFRGLVRVCVRSFYGHGIIAGGGTENCAHSLGRRVR